MDNLKIADIKVAFLAGYARALASRDPEDPLGKSFEDLYFDSPAANNSYDDWLDAVQTRRGEA